MSTAIQDPTSVFEAFDLRDAINYLLTDNIEIIYFSQEHKTLTLGHKKA